MDQVAPFFDERTLTQVVEHFLTIFHGNGVFKFTAGGTNGGAFDGQPGIVIGNAHPHGATGQGGQVALTEAAARCRELTPVFTNNKKFTFNFDSHVFLLGINGMDGVLQVVDKGHL